MISLRLARKAIALSLAVVLTQVCPFAAAKTFDLCGPNMTTRPKITWVFQRDDRDTAKTIKKYVKAAIALALGTVDVPSAFTVNDQNSYDSNGHQADQWKNVLELPAVYFNNHLEFIYVDGVAAAHETGHLIFQAILEHFAPKAYAKYAAANLRRDRRYDKIDEFITSYAELFCDMMALLVTDDLRPLADDEEGNARYFYRQWGDTSKLPWEKRDGADNYPSGVGNNIVYARFTGTRQFLWEEYRGYLQGSQKKRRQILAAVGEAMAAEIEANFTEGLSDRKLNESLNKRIKAAMDQI